MALVSTRTYTWAQLASSSVTWADFDEWTGNGTTISGASTDFAPLIYTTDEIDNGVSRTFYPTVVAVSNGSHAIVVQTSPNNTDWTTVSLGAISARYVRFIVTVTNGSATASLTSVESELFFNTIQETFFNLSVGATATTLPISNTYSNILGIRYDAPHHFEVVLTDTTKTAPKVISYDLDTWGKIASATTANITVIGFPNVAVDSFGNIGVT